MRTLTLLKLTAVAVAVLCSNGRAEDEFDRAPIEYRTSTPENCISRLQNALDAGERRLTYTGEHGYLVSLLAALNVPKESQMLVYSKTSLQLRRIAPRTPRAVYFNDSVYVGFCQSGDVLEISAVDPQLGTVFYTLDQDPEEPPKFRRAIDNCLICHSSSRTEGVPGHLVRSLFVDEGGQPMYSAGSRVVDHTTPLKDRWGGWYVTGTHGTESHLGNLVITTKDVPEPLNNSQGQNVVKLDDRFNVSRYLSPHSDIVALMILEHQTLVHNRITKANFATRQALHYEATMNKALGYDEGTPLESTARRIQSAGDDLVEALLMVGEAPITSPISGTSGFAEKFSATGPFDSNGRSLRQLDFKTRMFQFPCSYLVYSEAFDGLPSRMKDYVWERIETILASEDTSEKYAHLSAAIRWAISEIPSRIQRPADWQLHQVQVSPRRLHRHSVKRTVHNAEETSAAFNPSRRGGNSVDRNHLPSGSG
ncbi:MAG: hypothetical protein R3C59_30025 [Planctomycetaceae bacterium]